MAEKHAVLATINSADQRPVDVLVFEGDWNAAQGVWGALDKRLRKSRESENFDTPLLGDVTHFSVRSVDDPRVARAWKGDKRHLPGVRWGRVDLDAVSRNTDRMARNEYRAWRRKRIGSIALEAVKDENLGTLNAVLARTLERAREAGFDLDLFEAQDAVKARIIIGRTEGSSGTRRRDGVAYFAPKSAGKLHELRAPDGRPLYQTTLALQAPFYRLEA